MISRLRRPAFGTQAGRQRARRRAETGAALAALARSERGIAEMRAAHSRLSSFPNSMVARIAAGGITTAKAAAIPPRAPSPPTSGRILGLFSGPLMSMGVCSEPMLKCAASVFNF